MSRARRICSVVSVSALVVGLASREATADDPPRAAVDAAIARGVDHLRSEQDPTGQWNYSFNHDHVLGMTALAGLALLENGVEPTDPAIGRASEVVKALGRRSELTYDVSLAILFLARVQQGQSGPNDALIRRLARRLEAGSNDGIWNYTLPVVADEETGETSSSTPSRTRNQSRRPRRPGDGDNSNTQFALLGIWAAGRHGFDSNAALEEIDRHFRTTSDEVGRWGYKPGEGVRNAMTCAGLMGLSIAAARPTLAERQTARARGVALAADPAFVAALNAVGKDAHGINRRSEVYYLWSLERVCVALGLRDLDGLDWYSVGARELLRRQRPDGSWPDERWGSLPNTCLALLFLRRANLAFELDRVLKLPTASGTPSTSKTARQDDPAEPPKRRPAGVTAPGEDATVVVTGASDSAFPEIAVDFEVRKPDGTFLVDATRDDFKVTEEGQPVEVLRLLSPTGEARPITVVLVVDHSLSMEEEDRIGGLKTAVSTFLKGLPKGSRVAVVAFGSTIDKICPFTDDFARVQATVNALKPAGATRYYDAVAESLELLNHESGRRAVLAMTDGEDTFSQTATLETVISAARRLGLPVHTLGLGSEDEIESNALRQLADSTRGQYYPARQAEQLRTIYEELAQRLRSSYTLVYRSDRKIPDGTLRPVRVVYRTSEKAGETAVFIPGMVVPAAGWSRLFLGLVFGLVLLAWLPKRRA
jgi:Ca-activated chloride channel family protein